MFKSGMLLRVIEGETLRGTLEIAVGKMEDTVGYARGGKKNKKRRLKCGRGSARSSSRGGQWTGKLDASLHEYRKLLKVRSQIQWTMDVGGKKKLSI